MKTRAYMPPSEAVRLAALRDEWRQVVGWPSYEVSRSGMVRSVRRMIVDASGRLRVLQGRLLHQWVPHPGYPAVTLGEVSPKRKAIIRVHRLVAEAFVSNPLGLPQVNHLDGNKLNPDASNLEWVDARGNALHAIRAGLKKPTPGLKGEAAAGVRLTLQQVIDARRARAAGETWTSIARRYGVDRSTVQKAATGKNWAHAKDAA
jgi:hypothetical protein